MRAHGDGLARFRQLGGKGKTGAGGQEFFEMHGRFRPTGSFGRFAHPTDHPLGAADIQMRADGLAVQQPFQVNHHAIVVEV